MQLVTEVLNSDSDGSSEMEFGKAHGVQYCGMRRVALQTPPPSFLTSVLVQAIQQWQNLNLRPAPSNIRAVIFFP
jgi:hypothetical protein